MHLAVDTSLPDAPHDTRALTPGPRHLARKLSIFDHLPERPVKKICCIGAGYVGGPTCAVIANRVPDVQVTVVDLDQRRIDAWNSNSLPIYEPNLFDIVKPARDGIPGEREPNLFFSTDVGNEIAEADIIFVSVNTPTKLSGMGAGSASDLGYVEAAVRKIAEVSVTDKIIVEKSTVPCRTAESIRDILSANARPGVHFDVLSNPEFLAEGTAISDLLYPDRILIGSLPDEAGVRACATLQDIYAKWVPREKIITMNLWSSELAKLAANAMLAQRISSINALSAVCEATGAAIDEVSFAVGLDRRIGPWMLKSSVGFGGSCFKKDILSLVYLSETLHLPEVAAYWRSVVEINEWQKSRFTRRIVSCLYGTLVAKRVAILGFAYKKNTGDTRESAAISIVQALIAERADITIYDPEVKEEQIWRDLSTGDAHYDAALRERVTIARSAILACEGASAVVIVTEWDEFKAAEDMPASTAVTLQPRALPIPIRLADTASKSTPPAAHTTGAVDLVDGLASLRCNSVSSTSSSSTGTSPPRNPTERVSGLQMQKHASESRPRLDWARVATVMRRPMFVFDGRNIVDGAKLERLGFRVEGIGMGRQW